MITSSTLLKPLTEKKALLKQAIEYMGFISLDFSVHSYRGSIILCIG